MRTTYLVSIVFLLIILVGGYALWRSDLWPEGNPTAPPVTQLEMSPNPNEPNLATPSPLRGSNPSEVANETAPPSPEELPDNWTSTYDGALSYQAAYPQGYTHRPAINADGESAFYSFDPQQTPDTGGVPQNQLKIAVVRFAAGDERVVEPPSQVSSVTVDGRQSERWQSSGMGTSLHTLVPTGNGQQYLITAYPANSQYLGVYEQFLAQIELDAPAPVELQTPPLNGVVSSLLTVQGTAPGPWFFEGQLELALQNFNGEELVGKAVTTQDDWMTEGRVNWQTQLNFNDPQANGGYLVITKSNPSGLPQRGVQFTWPVRFE